MKLVAPITVIILLMQGTLIAVKPEKDADVARFVEYLAGTSLITNDKRLSEKGHAEKYRQLCKRTGVNAAMAEAFLRGYEQRPEEWQTVQSAVLKVLDSIK